MNAKEINQMKLKNFFKDLRSKKIRALQHLASGFYSVYYHDKLEGETRWVASDSSTNYRIGYYWSSPTIWLYYTANVADDVKEGLKDWGLTQGTPTSYRDGTHFSCTVNFPNETDAIRELTPLLLDDIVD